MWCIRYNIKLIHFFKYVQNDHISVCYEITPFLFSLYARGNNGKTGCSLNKNYP